MQIMSVLIAGAGAVGLMVAQTLFKYSPMCVTILAKGERLRRYIENGLWVNDRKVEFQINPGKKADLIIIACKYHHLEEVIEDITPSIGPETIILSLLNGISSEEIIGKKLGRQRLPLAMILGTDAFHDGTKTIYTRKGIIHFGDAEGRNGEREKTIAEFFERAGVDYKLEPNMKRTLWYKFMINVGVNQTTAVLRLPYGAISKKDGKRDISKEVQQEIPEARQLIEKAMREVISVANAEGVDLNENDLQSWYNTVNNLDPAGYTSMCQDVLAKRKTELEMFGMTMIELGKKHGIPVPVNEILNLQLRTIEKSYKLS